MPKIGPVCSSKSNVEVTAPVVLVSQSDRSDGAVAVALLLTIKLNKGSGETLKQASSSTLSSLTKIG